MELMETGRERELQPGDVLMCARKVRGDDGKKRWWQFFLVVQTHKRWMVVGRRVGAPEGKEEMRFSFGDPWVIHFVPPEEWPDGIHQFRAMMILTGVIEDVV